MCIYICIYILLYAKYIPIVTLLFHIDYIRFKISTTVQNISLLKELVSYVVYCVCVCTVNLYRLFNCILMAHCIIST